MKYAQGRCLLQERLAERRMTLEELAGEMSYKRERLTDYIENKRIMPLRVAVSIADTVGCSARDLYEWLPAEQNTEEEA
ncbi:helix-turn-helix domain-containing protein [Cohnella sp. GCM10027633]|uniref:helix-turn-helix domain-containing protein n=1 Tax=unclassified Cohnella TaxID=2636738 RepID=UPI0036323273